MNPWKYFAIGHHHHVVCNPLSEAKVNELVELLALPGAARVLDIACGKAEFVIRTARRWKCQGVGVDISPHCVTEARAKVEAANLASSIVIVEANGSEYDAEPSSFDATACLGASWIWSGLGGTLRALSSWTKVGGLVLVGEPFWRRTPSPEHLDAAHLTASTFNTHARNVEVGLGVGLRLLHTIVSSTDDWDRYEGYQWYAAERYATQHPADPDVPELLARMRAARDQYLRWGREEIGWATYMFLKNPGS